MISWIKLALALLQIVRWIMTKVDREQWKAEGRAEVLTETLALITKDAGVVKDVSDRIREMTDADIDAGFGGEFRP